MRIWYEKYKKGLILMKFRHSLRFEKYFQIGQFVEIVLLFNALARLTEKRIPRKRTHQKLFENSVENLRRKLTFPNRKSPLLNELVYQSIYTHKSNRNIFSR